MKRHTEYFTFDTKKKRELVRPRPKLEEVAPFDGQQSKRLVVKVLGE